MDGSVAIVNIGQLSHAGWPAAPARGMELRELGLIENAAMLIEEAASSRLDLTMSFAYALPRTR